MAQAADIFGTERVECDDVGGKPRNGSGERASWQRAHEELLRLAKKRAGLDFEEGRWLLSALRAGTHMRLGHGSFVEYAERLFGYSPRLTQEKLRVAEALEGLPETARALESGGASFSAVRELTRVATPVTEREWLEAAQGRTVREVEQLVSGHRPGNRPDDARDARLKRHVLRLEVSGEAMATFREAMAKIRRDAGEALDDDGAILLLVRAALEGPRETGRANYQIALTVCEECGRGKQEGRGELVEVGPEIVEMAECDAQYIGHFGAGPQVSADPGAHVGAGWSARQSRSRRASQSIPPALKRAVLRRDGHRCAVPGCRHATFVDVHHLVPRSDGGKHTIENLTTMCAAHHHAVHYGRLNVRGTPSTGLLFFHADGAPYGALTTPSAADARAKTHRALMQLGYRETEARRALAKVPCNPAASVELVLRQALRELAARNKP